MTKDEQALVVSLRSYNPGVYDPATQTYWPRLGSPCAKAADLIERQAAEIAASTTNERAMIVEWLREFGNHGNDGADNCLRCRLAEAIQRGDHIKA
jgi:hypothetical protein